MPSSGLEGPYALTDEVINTVVTRTSPGAYATGRYDSQDKTFYISYVGRDDKDVNDRLCRHVGKYADFKFGFCSTPKEAFEKECWLYHTYSPPDNKYHPARPDGTNYRCPIAGCPH